MASRRSLKEAIHADSELSQFVFGEQLIQELAVDGEVRLVPLSTIHRTLLQKRRYFDQQKIEEWAEHEIRINGIRSPLWVRPLANGQAGNYELVAGERRYRAAEYLGLAEVPVRIFQLDDRQALIASLVENMQRQDLNPLEETEGTLEVLSMELNRPTNEVIRFLYQMNNATKGKVNQNVLVSPEAQVVEQAFGLLGRVSWRSFVTSRLPLLNKPQDILDALREGKIEYSKAMEIAKVREEGQRRDVLEQAIAQNLSLTEIRSLIRSLNQEDHEGSQPSLEEQIFDVIRRFRKARVWEDPKRKRQIEKLLGQMESLLK